MGWTKSASQNEVLSRCKHRIQVIREAVSSCNDFAAAQSGYALCLKNTGAALTDYISQELSYHSSSIAAPATPRVFIPRRLLSSPSFHNPANTEPNSVELKPQMNPATLRRAVSMPEMDLYTESISMGPATIEELELELQGSSNGRASPEPFSVAESVLRPQMNPATLWRAVSMPEIDLSTESKSIWPTAPVLEPQMKKLGIELGKTGKLMSLIQIFHNLDNHFLKASEGAHETSKLLKATRLGHIDHLIDTEGNATHAKLLAIILAWEEKLYDEMKAGETAKHEYQKKIASLTKKDKQGSDVVSLEKRKAAASNVHIKYIVNMQSIDSTVEQINGLRDEQLYPKLLQLLDGMATMWETVRYNHEIQAGIVHALKSLDSFQPLEETSIYRNNRILQLYLVVLEWYTYFCRLVDFQKDHVRALYNWLNFSPPLKPIHRFMNLSRHGMMLWTNFLMG